MSEITTIKMTCPTCAHSFQMKANTKSLYTRTGKVTCPNCQERANIRYDGETFILVAQGDNAAEDTVEVDFDNVAPTHKQKEGKNSDSETPLEEQAITLILSWFTTALFGVVINQIGLVLVNDGLVELKLSGFIEMMASPWRDSLWLGLGQVVLGFVTGLIVLGVLEKVTGISDISLANGAGVLILAMMVAPMLIDENWDWGLPVDDYQEQYAQHCPQIDIHTAQIEIYDQGVSYDLYSKRLIERSTDTPFTGLLFDFEFFGEKKIENKIESFEDGFMICKFEYQSDELLQLTSAIVRDFSGRERAYNYRWYPNGQLMERSVYNDGELTEVMYNENGSIKERNIRSY